MTTLDAQAPSSPAVPRAVRASGVLLAAVVLVAVGYAIGNRDDDAVWRGGSARVGLGMATIESAGQYYGLSESVAWIDSSGIHHQDGWPACLDVRAGTTVKHVRFATVDVDTGNLAWRQVVLVDCQRT